jgi:hypothetical protein
MTEKVAQEVFVRFLREAGGNRNANGDYSSTATEFSYTAANHRVSLRTLTITVTDLGAFRQDYYGVVSTITNGVRVLIKDEDSTVQDLTNGTPVRSLSGWASFASRQLDLPLGPGDGTVHINWNFSNTFGADVILGVGQRFVIELNDDFSGLSNHFFLLSGSLTQGG